MQEFFPRRLGRSAEPCRSADNSLKSEVDETMRPIQMVDLQTQYQHIQEEIDAGIREVLRSAAFVKGPKVGIFAEHLAAWLGVRHVIPVGNGTDALQIAFMSLGLERGDEVITPTFTFVATAEAAAVLGNV